MTPFARLVEAFITEPGDEGRAENKDVAACFVEVGEGFSGENEEDGPDAGPGVILAGLDEEDQREGEDGSEDKGETRGEFRAPIDGFAGFEGEVGKGGIELEAGSHGLPEVWAERGFRDTQGENFVEPEGLVLGQIVDTEPGEEEKEAGKNTGEKIFAHASRLSCCGLRE